jgi:uncharacterized membrane protein (UPF0127 family)
MRKMLDVLSGAGEDKPASPYIVRNLTRGVEIARNVDLAGHSGDRRKGLLGKTGLGPDEGLWILPCEAVHTFFMKFPIDLIYIDQDRVVRKVRSSVPAWRLSGCLSAHSVLELAAGTIERTQARIGDRLEFVETDTTNPKPADPNPGDQGTTPLE